MNVVRTVKSSASKQLILAASVLISLVGSARAAIKITEVNSNGSSAPYLADWFELTNTNSFAVDITGWKIDDSSHAFATALLLRNVTSIGPGQSVIFAEGNTSGSNDSTIAAAFIAYWFGGTAPPGFTIGGYGGSMIGLSGTSGDEVVIFDSLGNVVTGVAFGALATGATLDNAAGIGGTAPAYPTISTVSVAGVNGAFVSAVTVPASETGSPGTIGAAVPEPGSAVLLILGAGLLMLPRLDKRPRRGAVRN